MKERLRATALLLMCFVMIGAAGGQEIRVTVEAGSAGKPISGKLFGIFFEDLNYAADGGLYAEMVQNRSFEYSSRDVPGWHAFTGWEVVQRDGGTARYYIGDVRPLHPNNPQYLELHCETARQGSSAGISNSGFGGMVVKAGENYVFSVFARQQPQTNFSLEVRLESRDGTVLGRAEIAALTQDWKQYKATLEADRDDSDAQLVVLARGSRGVVYLDMVSLFPHKTFRGRPNGLRRDLGETLAALKPKFVRFPGGCLAHGDGLNNIYHWKDTIGPVEQRKAQKNIWRYHQTMGLGYFEYFQFCMDIGAEPVPVVAAGVSCQNSDRYWGVGQQAIPLDEMDGYVQDVLDLIEWANGPADSRWGAKRAAAGRAEPFGLKYLAAGNEDAQTPAFRERFKIIYEAVKAQHPEITVIGNVGPAPDGEDYEAGWAFARELGLGLVAEHYYRSPEWFLNNLGRYDGYDRRKGKVFVSEYAAHDTGRRTTLRAALAEAAFMTGLERNGDVVEMACYAPLLGKIGNTQWNPNLIYFTNERVIPTISYYVQRMFGEHSGDVYLPVAVSGSGGDGSFAVSCVRDSKTGTLFLKLVNPGQTPTPIRIDLSEAEGIATRGVKTVLSGEPMAVNDIDHPQRVVPETSVISVGPNFAYEAPSHSLTVIRIDSQRP